MTGIALGFEEGFLPTISEWPTHRSTCHHGLTFSRSRKTKRERGPLSGRLWLFCTQVQWVDQVWPCQEEGGYSLVLNLFPVK